MPQVIIVGIGMGADFSTWQAAIDDLPATLDDAYEIRGQDETFSVAGTVANIPNMGGTSTNTLTLTTVAGASWRDKAGVRTTPYVYNAANGTALVYTSTSAGDIINVNNNHTRFIGLQINSASNTALGASLNGINFNGTDFITVDNCIFQFSTTSTNRVRRCVFSVEAGTTGLLVRNNLFRIITANNNPRGVELSDPAGQWRALGNTFIGSAASNGRALSQIGGSDNRLEAQGNAMFAFGDTPISATSNQLSFNASNVSSLPGSNNLTSLTQGDQFEGAADFRVKSGADLIGHLPTASAHANYLSEDASGVTRPANITVGAWEFEDDEPDNGETIEIDSGSYTTTGHGFSLLVGRRITIDSGSYAITGHDIEFLKGFRISIDSGSYQVTGHDFDTFVTTFDRLIFVKGSYQLTGHDINFRGPHRITIQSGSYIITGNDINLIDSTIPIPPPPAPPPGFFDPLAVFPPNLLPTPSRLLLLINFFEQNQRAPTAEEAVALLGQGVDHGDRTDPLPDGFAGRDWRNPRWLRRLVQKS
jgi:hypothetical protein